MTVNLFMFCVSQFKTWNGTTRIFYRKQFVSSEGTNSILQVYHHMLWEHNVADGM